MKQRNILLLIQPAYPERIQGIARFAKAHGWHLTIVDRLARFPRGWRGDGALVTLRGNEKTNRFVKGLVRDGVPVVDLTFNHPEIKLPRVSGDHGAFGQLARKHYESLNFRHFSWFSSGWSHVHELRYNGFCTTSSDTGASGQKTQRWVLSELLPDSDLDDWRRFLKVIGRKLQTAPKPLAILTYDDADAAKVLSCALEAGLRVPEDVSIMGIGNDAVICENQAVPLSSIGHDLDLNGFEGAALLNRLMNQPAQVRHSNAPCNETILLPPRGIVIRKSTDTLAADNELLSAALHAISKRLDRSFGIDEIAESLNITRAQLDRLFSASFARPVGQEIARQRIERAKKLLDETTHPIKQIAALCGYCNAGYFTNSFREATGFTPKSWRHRNRRP